MNKMSKLYIFITLLLSWLLTFVLYSLGKLVAYIPVIMLVPIIVALVVRVSFQGFSKSIYRNPEAKGLKAFLKALIFSIAFPIIAVSACALLGSIIYGQDINNEFIVGLFNYKYMPLFIIMSILPPSVFFSLGEEYGWRAFLLPELCKTHSKVAASTIVGVVWALYHFPVMILLNVGNVGIMQAILMALVQGIAAFVFSYIFSYCYFLSNRVLPTVVMHGFWNIYNPYVLGSVYLGTKGSVLHEGPVLMTNGEGVFGILFGGITAIVLIMLMKNKSIRKI